MKQRQDWRACLEAPPSVQPTCLGMAVTIKVRPVCLYGKNAIKCYCVCSNIINICSILDGKINVETKKCYV